MTVATAIPELWSARILDGFQRTNTWANLITDVSEELSDGDTLNLNEVTSGVTVKDYDGTDIDAPETMTTDDQALVINQQKYFNIEVDDIDRVQARPALLDHFALQAGREVAKVYDEHLSGTFIAGIDAAHSFAAGTLPALNALPSVTDEVLQAFVSSINAAVTNLQAGGSDWPTDLVFLVLNNQAGFAVREYLVRQGVIGSGEVNNAALVRGAISNLFGVSVGIDVNLPAAGANGQAYGYFGTRDAVYTATQIRRVEAYRPEKRFTDALRGLFVYGSKVVQADHRAKLIRSANPG